TVTGGTATATTPDNPIFDDLRPPFERGLNATGVLTDPITAIITGSFTFDLATADGDPGSSVGAFELIGMTLTYPSEGFPYFPDLSPIQLINQLDVGGGLADAFIGSVFTEPSEPNPRMAARLASVVLSVLGAPLGDVNGLNPQAIADALVGTGFVFSAEVVSLTSTGDPIEAVSIFRHEATVQSATLTITGEVPLPAGFWLMLSGIGALGGLAAARRRAAASSASTNRLLV
ncbi:MAG: hypothetical protein AAGA22_09680, partial [Pseudomonadota bacterium]